MTFQEVATMVSGIGLEYCYYQFETGPEDDPPELPYLCYYYTGNDDLVADNTNYQPIVELIVELYSDVKDFEHETTVEAALTEAGLVYDKRTTYIESERMYMTTYTTEVLITNG